MNVLLTGATGLVGSHALDVLLAEGHSVHAVARHAGAPREGVVWHEADLLHPAAAMLARDVGATHMLHLAWYVVPGSFWNAPENERWIDASLRLLRAFGEAGGRRAVMAGTCAEYAWGEPLLRERDTPLQPATLYGRCKHSLHVAAEALATQLDVSFGWGRIFFMYGPGEDPARLVAGVARGLLAGEDVSTTDGRQQRDFMHVRDVAAAFVALLRSDVSGPVNIATGKPVPVRELVELIAEQINGVERVRFGALARRVEEPEVIAGSARRLTEEVGFEPAISLEQGIAETVSWWRDHA